MTTLEPRISRPRPSAEWAVQWYDGPTGSVLAARRLTVTASHGNPPDFGRYAPTDPDDPDVVLPNRITITSRTGSERGATPILLDRKAAEDLAGMLTAALGWDGR